MTPMYSAERTHPTQRQQWSGCCTTTSSCCASSSSRSRLPACSLPSSRVARHQWRQTGAMPPPLARATLEPGVRYEYQGQTFTVDDYLARNPATGLLVARGDTIFIERYQYARHDRHRFTSWSMAKTVTSMLVGIALAEGRLRSVDDPAVAYAPA